MEAKLKQLGEIAIVSIHGPLVIERTQSFRDACQKHYFGKKVIFNMENTNFVGSTGIQSFIDAMKLVSEKTNEGLRLVGLRSEFKKIFQNLNIQGLEIHEDEGSAIRSLSVPENIIINNVILGDPASSD